MKGLEMSELPQRPTISLALIAKNEAHNLPRLLDSVHGCFDEIVLVDTGSTDDTKQIAEKYGCTVHDFEWVNSFSKARNYAFSKCTKDFIAWLDCDDVLWNKDAFIKWRDHGMEHCDFAFNTYHYAVKFDETKPWAEQELTPIVSFVRERVFKRSLNPTWQYDLHEGIIAKPEWRKSYVTTWAVKHLRSNEDMKADRSRNLRIIEEMESRGKLDARMQFYYGKELYEAGRPEEAIRAFEKAVKMEGLEPHDRVLALQYGAYAASAAYDRLKDECRDEKERFFQSVLSFAHEGLKLEPSRAEFHAVIGDLYLRAKQIDRSVPYFAAAKACLKNFDSPYADPIFHFRNLYGEQPSLQLAKIYAHLGLLDKAKKEAEECLETYKNEEAGQVLAEIARISTLVTIERDQAETEDIVFTCPPQTAYPFDEEIYKTKPLGGSETALVQMARLLKEKTGRPVKVFNMRDAPLVASSGVEYLPASKLNEYMSKHRPHTHIAWRHNIKCTSAKSYLWAHDLITPTIETIQNFDHMFCLSQFHKDYTMAMSGVPEDKILVTRNGIDPKKFQFERKEKNPNKVVFMSSPDRGLDRAMLVMDRVREKCPDAELHVYYGLENLYKFGMADLAEKLKGMMNDRPWVKYHGFVEQSKMYHEVSDAVLWLHPCDFIETFCITALEMLALKVYPVTRKLGALKNTLAASEAMGDAILLSHDCKTEVEFEAYASKALEVLQEKKWERMHDMHLDSFSWDAVADEWIEIMDLKQKSAEKSA